MGLLLLLSLVALGHAATYKFTVTNAGSNAWMLTSIDYPGTLNGQNPTLTNIFPGDLLDFTVAAAGHPFAIHRTQSTTSTGDRFDTGVTGQGTQTGTVLFNVPVGAPTTLWGNCETHSAMSFKIEVGFPDATETGVLSFRNTLQQAPPFSSPCCSAVYIEDAMLEVGQQSLNFSSPGTSGTCGPSPPGWFIFANLSWVSGTCYVGDLTVFNPVAGAIPFGRGRINWDAAAKASRLAVLGNSETADCAFPDQTTLLCSGSASSFYQPIAGCFGAGCPSSCANCTTGVTTTTGSGTMTTTPAAAATLSVSLGLLGAIFVAIYL